MITLSQQYLGVAFTVGSEAASVKAWHLGTVVIPRRSITGRPSSRSGMAASRWTQMDLQEIFRQSGFWLTTRVCLGPRQIIFAALS